MLRKKISKNLVFTKLMQTLDEDDCVINTDDLLYEVGTMPKETPNMFMGEREERDSWERYLQDIKEAKSLISIDIPGAIYDDEDMLESLVEGLAEAKNNGVPIVIRAEEKTNVPNALKGYVRIHSYVTTPFTMIDNMIVWFGEPISAANFISEGVVLKNKYFPCMRFKGKYTARMLKAIYEVKN